MGDFPFEDFEPIARRGQLSLLVKTDARTVALVSHSMAERLGDDQVYALAWIMPDSGDHFPLVFLSRERLIEWAAEMQPRELRADDLELQEMLRAAARGAVH
jgi:hypothetical protein